MAVENPVSTPQEIKSLGGEVLTQMPQGTLIGAATGVIIGIALSLFFSSGVVYFPGLVQVSGIGLSIFVILFCTIFFAFAGTLVGIGVPKFNPRPEQGLVKKWRKTVLMRGGKTEKIVYIPEEKRKDGELEYHLT